MNDRFGRVKIINAHNKREKFCEANLIENPLYFLLLLILAEKKNSAADLFEL